MTRQIYVVRATVGEYSERTEYCVAAYFAVEQAQIHVERATVRARELAQYADWGTDWTIPSGANDYDPQMTTDAIHVRDTLRYTCVAVPLFDVESTPKTRDYTL